MNYMLEQIHSLPDLIHQIVESLEDTIQQKIDKDLCTSLERLYVVGCGDSHHAALSTQLAFRSLTDLPIEPMTSMQFARYTAGFIPQNRSGKNVVIGISVSGAVARTAEALRMGKRAGALAVALTAAPDSAVGKEADLILDVPVPDFPIPVDMVIPGVRSYLTSQVALTLLAIHIGAMRGNLTGTETAAYRKQIMAFGDLIQQTIAACEPIVEKTAQDWVQEDEFVFTGSGPNYATALFNAAKIVEASGDSALGQDIEEWAHLQYFAKKVGTPTFLISAGERDLSRASEIAIAALQIGRKTAVVCPKSVVSLIKFAHYYFPIPQVEEMFSPLLASIPGELFSAYLAEKKNEPYFRDFQGGRDKEGGGGISRIRTSEMWKEWMK